ncbi:MAG: sigma-70 family RNA polymerase sigma factor, partial [Saprospiraceae bacterium]
SFKAGSNFSAWMSTIMRNTFINNYRIQKRNYTLTGKISKNKDNIMPQSTSNKGESNQIVAELMALVNELQEDAKIPFLLHYAGYQYDEIATQLEVPLGTIKSKIFYARKDLKASIKKRYKVGHYSEILG